jgi:3-deoxy-D-manno-octulosonic-acid transferase
MGARVEAVRAIGNLKYDVRAAKETEMTKRIRSALGDARLVVAGSLLEGEETALLAAWPAMQEESSDVVLLIAPRHPQRFSGVVEMIRSADCAVLRCSTLDGAIGRISDGTVLVLDTLGDLAAMYGLADVAFVGGSLVKRGGHNPLEPAQFGVPVVMGPSYENFREVVGKMLAVDGIRIVQDKDELESALVELLTDREAARAMGERGRRVFEEQQGATGRAVAALVGLVRDEVRR